MLWLCCAFCCAVPPRFPPLTSCHNMADFGSHSWSRGRHGNRKQHTRAQLARTPISRSSELTIPRQWPLVLEKKLKHGCRASGPSWQNIGSPRHFGPSNPPGDIPFILRLVILHHNTTHTHRRLQLQSGMYLANLVMLHPMIHSRPGSPLEQCCRGSQPQAPRPASQTNAPSNVHKKQLQKVCKPPGPKPRPT